ncbi:uncharacterized protein LACBIDRAFT_312489 [Laccaria bicolor S238N-H82]|uniref:Predicted protein n=1 Tax=Laccaria bicolor (strain S238N-H82 / ATCC MYA-4686) TaxID=486041 RepID=B0DWA3_LACBS|nr:uncharacterized protein LACBIDRAFT_312489 [Laccaria bicolor S238N-H82]EDR01190.1 predicted protein [Laccaria bicolor S238N-H82]|eukprot:XP_001888232.1 predicted protein [Laccaria bicolor S238N-H82]
MKGLTPNRSAMFLHLGFALSPPNYGRRSTFSVPVSSGGHKSPTTFSAPPPPPPPHTPAIPLSSAGTQAKKHLGPPFDAQTTPQTPGYPAFPPKSTIPRPPCPLAPSPRRHKQTSAQASRFAARGVQRARYPVRLGHTSSVHLVNSRGC